MRTVIIMPLFMVKREAFDLYRFGKRDVELRAVKPQWKNSKVKDNAVLLCGREILRKRITEIHRGSLARIFLDVYYKRVFPEAETIFEAVHETRKIYPQEVEFMAFELVQ